MAETGDKFVKNEKAETRVERDSLGEVRIPRCAYYGAQTRRAVENFPVSGLKLQPSFIEATVQVKRAAAAVNGELGLLEPAVADSIIDASDEILGGSLREWFVVDVYQAGAGTSHNMNVNEVIANRANEILGHDKGTYAAVHPNDHVNMGQSTNDVIPTAIRIASIVETAGLLMNLYELKHSFYHKGDEFNRIVKSARTHLQDAVPIRLGQEFRAYGVNMKKHLEAVAYAVEASLELGIGGSAAGTGLNVHPEYRGRMIRQLSEQTCIDFEPAEDYFEAMQSLRPMVVLSGAIRNLAQDLSRIAGDLRLLSSGPKTGLAEIRLPAVQPGSSIMPGKVNPVMAEMLNMVCFQVMGCDTTIVHAAQAGQLELNVMMPVAAFNLLHETSILSNAIAAFNRRCVAGITANSDRCRGYAEGSMGIVTVLNPHIGYDAATEIAKEYLRSGKSIRELVREKGLLSEEQIDAMFDLYKMTEPGIY
jgi:aspartate ammonia-lyase